MDEIGRSLINRFQSRAIKRSEGRNRIVFDLGNGLVVKLPKNAAGASDNIYESKQHGPQYPRTKIVFCLNVPVLFAQIVIPANEDQIFEKLGTIPRWVYSIDRKQVGFTRKGDLVAFDYGLN